jgi:hypothetical protein
MKVAVPHITPTSFAVNALFLQPTTLCARNCNGCYVKGFEKNENFTTDSRTNAQLSVFEDLLNKINRDSRYLVNQLTLAVDTLPSIENQLQNEFDFYHLLVVYLHFLGASRANRTSSLEAEFHITVHTVKDLLAYINFTVDKTRNNIKYPLDMVSISHLNPTDGLAVDTIRTYFSQNNKPVDINWNLTVDPSINIQKIMDTFEETARLVDSVYLVLHKPSTGSHLQEKAYTDWVRFAEYIKTLDPSIQKKVHLDGCISDAKRFISTGFGCSSNTSRFQIWPDLSVTGCAYNQNRITSATTTFDGLVENIYKASKQYEFSSCKIPDRVDSKADRVVARKSYLEILD